MKEIAVTVVPGAQPVYLGGVAHFVWRGAAYEIPEDVRYILPREDGVFCYRSVRLEGPPAPCGLVAGACSDDDYWTPRDDLMTVVALVPLNAGGAAT